MPDKITHEQAAELTVLLSRLMRRLYALETGDPAMEMPGAQMRVCAALLERPRTITCLSKELGTSLSAATQLADRLEKSGLVERYTEADDLRVKRLRLTPHGEEIMRARRARRVDRLATVLDQMPPEDRNLIIPVLQSLYEASQSADQHPTADPLPVLEKLLD